MNLTELTTPLAAAYPVRELADHLRIGTGFADDGSQDDLLESYLRAAVSALEARTGKVVLEKDYAWEIGRWYSNCRQGLPVAPVSAVSELVTVTAAGDATIIDAARYNLKKDDLRPEVTADYLPCIPTRGAARITFTAGYGPAWDDVPADMRQAVLMLAAFYFENRGGCAGSASEMPFGVQALTERFRTVRLLGDTL